MPEKYIQVDLPVLKLDAFLLQTSLLGPAGCVPIRPDRNSPLRIDDPMPRTVGPRRQCGQCLSDISRPYAGLFGNFPVRRNRPFRDRRHDGVDALEQELSVTQTQDSRCGRESTSPDTPWDHPGPRSS